MTTENVGKFEQPLSVTLFEQEREFATARDVLDFIDGEKAFWSFFDEVSASNGPFREVSTPVKRGWDQIITGAQAFIDGRIQTQALPESIKNPLEGTYRRFPPRTDSRADYIKHLHEQEPFTASQAVPFLVDSSMMGKPVPITTRTYSGAFAAMTFRLGLSADVSFAQTETLSATQSDWTKFVGKAEQSHADHRTATEAQHEEIERATRELKERFDESVAANNTEIESIRATFNEEIEKTNARFNQQMSLQAPTKYWSDKASQHARLSKWLFGIGLVLLFAVAWTLYGLAPDWLKSLGQPETTASNKPNYYTLAFLVASAALLLWPVRLIIKIALTHFHLATDANERCMMVKTYLSMNEGKDTEMSKEERGFALASIFRPATDGVVKDDSSPLLYQEMIKSLGKAK